MSGLDSKKLCPGSKTKTVTVNTCRSLHTVE